MQEPFANAASVGASPGVEHDEIPALPDGPARACVTCVDYGPGRAQLQLIEDLEHFLGHHRPEWSSVRWINVDGLSDMNFHYIPELDRSWAYPAFWVVCLLAAGSMLLLFRRNDWL